MGVVRDITIEQLTQAVGGIDTSTLAQDSTLQDVVTAIGNISGGNDPVTNTTVNSLCKDATGQSIASAISGLATALGSDRALIDGSNIGSPATFRQNIGAVGQSSFYKTTVYGTTNSYGAISLGIPFGLNGYEVLSIRSNDNIYVIPFVYGTNWYAMFYTVGTHAPITNTSVNAVVCYADSSIFNIV